MESGSKDQESPFEYESQYPMKLPFQTLAVLLFFVGSPIGLMRLTSSAIENPKTYPLMSVAPSAGFATIDAVEKSIANAIAPNRVAYKAITELVGESTSLNRFRQFVGDHTVTRNAEYGVAAPRKRIPGLIVATERAIVSSWNELQPSYVALPNQLEKLQQRIQLSQLTNRATEYIASRPIPTRTPVPPAAFNGRKIPGLIVAAERALISSWNEIQPAVVAISTSQSRDFEGAATPAIRVARLVETCRSQARLFRGIGRLLETHVDNR